MIRIKKKYYHENWNVINQSTWIKSKQMNLERLALCVDNGYFCYKGAYYKQLYGVPMGGCLSGNFSGIFMNHVLDKVIKELCVEPMLMIKYVDDILAVVKANEVDFFEKI